MPNNSPAGIQRRFTSAELPRENVSTLTPDKLLHLASRESTRSGFFSLFALTIANQEIIVSILLRRK